MKTEQLDQIQVRADVVRRCYQAAPNDCYDMGDIDKAVEAQLEDVPALLAAVRSQQAQIERVRKLAESAVPLQGMGGMYSGIIMAEHVLEALTATEGA